MKDMKNYLTNLIEEKGKSLDTPVKIDGHIGMTLENVVEFICERLNFLKSINRQQKKAILFGNPRGGSYKLISYKYAIEDLKKTHSGILKAKVLEIQSKLGEGECIFNTNLDGIL